MLTYITKDLVSPLFSLHNSFAVFILVSFVLGLHGNVWVAEAATGVASPRSCQKLPLCLTEAVPAGSKTDLLLAKAKTVCNGGNASVITHLRRGEKPAQLKWERGVRIHERNNSAHTKVSDEGGGGGGAPGIGAEIPLQPMEKTMARQAFALQLMEICSGTDIHLQPRRIPHQSRWMPEGDCDAVGSPC